jgi:chromate transporter
MNRPEEPTLSELFWGFAKASISGFGGVLPFARRMIVDDKQWMSEREFAEQFAFCQFLPGANVMNLTVCVGSRMRGAPGALATASGMTVAPILVILLVGMFYNQFGHSPTMQGVFRGLGAVAAGLVVTTALKMGKTLDGGGHFLAAALAFAAIAWLRLPMLQMLAVLAPLSIAYQWWRPR